LTEYAEIIHKGDDSGNEMTVRWHQISLESRANELLQHHVERCAAIIKNLTWD
jgi:hypothetical protein